MATKRDAPRDTTIDIRPALAHEVDAIRAIEDEAALLFLEIPELANVPDVEGVPGEVYRAAQESGTLWCAVPATEAPGRPVGFALCTPHGDCLHLRELDVLTSWGRRGIGRQLVERVLVEAASLGFRAVTLTTYLDVAWNAPFYLSCGFEVLRAEETSGFLEDYLERETAMGLAVLPRVAMRHRFAGF